MNGRLEQVYLQSDSRLDKPGEISDSRLDKPGEGPLFELDFNKWWEGGCEHYSSHSLGPWPDMALE